MQDMSGSIQYLASDLADNYNSFLLYVHYHSLEETMMLCFGSVEYEGIEYDSGVNMCLGIGSFRLWIGAVYLEDECRVCRVWHDVST